ALREAMAASDPAALMRAAHTLKGSLRVLGAGPAAALAEQLEALGQAGGLEDAPAVLAAFEPELQRVLRAAASAARGPAAAAGLAACRARRQRATPYVYVILRTGRDRGEDRVAGLDAEADDFLTKPLDAVELRARLRSGQRMLESQERLREAQEALRVHATLE